MNLNTIYDLITTENMRNDLKFYLDHNSELYFKGMALVAVMFVVIVILGASSAIIYAKSDPVLSTLYMLAGLISTIGFVGIKLYLHVRKDAIEIKEMISELK